MVTVFEANPSGYIYGGKRPAYCKRVNNMIRCKKKKECLVSRIIIWLIIRVVYRWVSKLLVSLIVQIAKKLSVNRLVGQLISL